MSSSSTPSTKDLSALHDLLQKIETDIKRARMLIENSDNSWLSSHKQVSADDASQELQIHTNPTDAVQIVEWVYDGYFMVGSDKKKYPVPMNYASKTKLIPWDVLKLRVMEDGKLIYKLIGQANRKYVKATLSKTDENKFTALTDDGDMYYLNQAAVTYYKGQTGDELSIIVNGDGIGNFGAIEAVIGQG